MPAEAKEAVRELVAHLGGSYSQKMSRANTHLILQQAAGDKWRHAATFAVRPVTIEWLVESAAAGAHAARQGTQLIVPSC
jgi:hypothetical protein